MKILLGIVKLEAVPDRKTASANARALLFRMLRSEGLDASDGFAIETEEHGRPYLARLAPRVDFNLSHAERYVVCALSIAEADAAPRVGVDVEVPHRRIDPRRLAERFFSENELAQLRTADFSEKAFLDVWTAKEAYLKFTGAGLAHGMRETDTTYPEHLSPAAEIRHYRIEGDGAVSLALALPRGCAAPIEPTFFPIEDKKP